MPRRNRRDTVPPLDLTHFEVVPAPRTPTYTRDDRDRRAREERNRIERQKQARIAGGIDWSVCLVPGCGAELRLFGTAQYKDPGLRDPTKRLPLCTDHALLIWQNVQASKGDPVVMDANDVLLAKRAALAKAEHEAEKQRRLNTEAGHIYFVRLNGLIKVGWSREVSERLRAYGPEVQVLAIYPGTRTDETTLHRQLRPVLARGREWYQDCPVVTDYAAKMTEQHGIAHYYDWWTKPKDPAAQPRTRKHR